MYPNGCWQCGVPTPILNQGNIMFVFAGFVVAFLLVMFGFIWFVNRQPINGKQLTPIDPQYGDTAGW